MSSRGNVAWLSRLKVTYPGWRIESRDGTYVAVNREQPDRVITGSLADLDLKLHEAEAERRRRK